MIFDKIFGRGKYRKARSVIAADDEVEVEIYIPQETIKQIAKRNEPIYVNVGVKPISTQKVCVRSLNDKSDSVPLYPGDKIECTVDKILDKRPTGHSENTVDLYYVPREQNPKITEMRIQVKRGVLEKEGGVKKLVDGVMDQIGWEPGTV